MQIIFKTLWALSLVVFSATYVLGEDYVFRQDIQGSTDQPSRRVEFQMVDATDGYTPETGLTPTCVIKPPGATAFASCGNAPTGISDGFYRFALAPAEWEGLGNGLIYVTNVAARPVARTYKIIESGLNIKDGASLVKTPSNYGVSGEFARTGVTVLSNTSSTWDGYNLADTITGDGLSSRHVVDVTIGNVSSGSSMYQTIEVKGGSTSNVWFGDYALAVGINFNLSTLAVTPTTPATSMVLKGYKVDRLSSSWYRLHVLINRVPTHISSQRPGIALSNGTFSSNNAPIYVTSDTLLAARFFVARSADVAQELIDSLMLNLQSASDSSNMVLSAHESASSSIYIGREICFYPDHNASDTANVQGINGRCSCITSYNGTTKATVISPALNSTLSADYKYKIGGLCLNSLSGSVASVSGAVGSVTGAVGSVNTDQHLTFTIATPYSDSVALNPPATSSINDAYRGREICIQAGSTGAGQCRCIRSYDPSFRRAYLDRSWDTAPAIGGTVIIKDYCSSIVSRMDAGVVTNTAIADGAISSPKVAADTIGSSQIATSAAQEIGDTTLRRSSTNIEGSSNGDTLSYKSLYGVIAQQTHKSNASLGVQSVYKADGTTILNSRSYNSNASAEPITGLD